MISTKIVITNFLEKLRKLIFYNKIWMLNDVSENLESSQFKTIKVVSLKISDPDSVDVKLINKKFCIEHNNKSYISHNKG